MPDRYGTALKPGDPVMLRHGGTDGVPASIVREINADMYLISVTPPPGRDDTLEPLEVFGDQLVYAGEPRAVAELVE